MTAEFQQRCPARRRCATQLFNRETTTYASAEDLCLIFTKDMDPLYLLSFLLTGEHSLAEQCFVRGFEDSQEGNPVFKEWAQSWARRTIIQGAIRTIRPRPSNNRTSGPKSGDGSSDPTPPAQIANIVGLPQFERFVFVMSVLEHYSYQECSLLLNCTRKEVASGQARAFQKIASVAELSCKVVSIDSNKQERSPTALGSSRQPEATTGAESGLQWKASPRDERQQV